MGEGAAHLPRCRNYNRQFLYITWDEIVLLSIEIELDNEVGNILDLSIALQMFTSRLQPEFEFQLQEILFVISCNS